MAATVRPRSGRGYRLLLSVQDDSLSVKGLSWWPVVATIVLGQLVYTWWHAETPLFNQWEEQQQHLSGLNIITCMDHPPKQSSYPQTGSGSGTSNPWTWGSQETITLCMAVTARQGEGRRP